MTESLERLVASVRETGEWYRLAAALPYFRFLDVQIEEGEFGLITIMPANDKLIGNPFLPAIHGGVVGAFLESAAIIQLLATHETESIPKIVNLSVDYLRSAKPVETYAQAVIAKPGRRVANVRVEAWQGRRDKPVAAAHAHFLLR
jgi:uncharacterized protein (TIGR00369 family)